MLTFAKNERILVKHRSFLFEIFALLILFLHKGHFDMDHGHFDENNDIYGVNNGLFGEMTVFL